MKEGTESRVIKWVKKSVQGTEWRLWRQRKVNVCNRIREKCKEILTDNKEQFDLNRKKFIRISDSIKKEKLELRKYKQKFKKKTRKPGKQLWETNKKWTQVNRFKYEEKLTLFMGTVLRNDQEGLPRHNVIVNLAPINAIEMRVQYPLGTIYLCHFTKNKFYFINIWRGTQRGVNFIKRVFI